MELWFLGTVGQLFSASTRCPVSKGKALHYLLLKQTIGITFKWAFLNSEQSPFCFPNLKLYIQRALLHFFNVTLCSPGEGRGGRSFPWCLVHYSGRAIPWPRLRTGWSRTHQQLHPNPPRSRRRCPMLILPRCYWKSEQKVLQSAGLVKCEMPFWKPCCVLTLARRERQSQSGVNTVLDRCIHRDQCRMVQIQLFFLCF